MRTIAESWSLYACAVARYMYDQFRAWPATFIIIRSANKFDEFANCWVHTQVAHPCAQTHKPRHKHVDSNATIKVESIILGTTTTLVVATTKTTTTAATPTRGTTIYKNSKLKVVYKWVHETSTEREREGAKHNESRRWPGKLYTASASKSEPGSKTQVDACAYTIVTSETVSRDIETSSCTIWSHAPTRNNGNGNNNNNHNKNEDANTQICTYNYMQEYMMYVWNAKFKRFGNTNIAYDKW